MKRGVEQKIITAHIDNFYENIFSKHLNKCAIKIKE